MKPDGWVEWVTRMNRLDFGEDPDQNTMIFKSDSSPLRDKAKNDKEHDILKKTHGWVMTKLGG